MTPLLGYFKSDSSKLLITTVNSQAKNLMCLVTTVNPFLCEPTYGDGYLIIILLTPSSIVVAKEYPS